MYESPSAAIDSDPAAVDGEVVRGDDDDDDDDNDNDNNNDIDDDGNNTPKDMRKQNRAANSPPPPPCRRDSEKNNNDDAGILDRTTACTMEEEHMDDSVHGGSVPYHPFPEKVVSDEEHGTAPVSVKTAVGTTEELGSPPPTTDDTENTIKSTTTTTTTTTATATIQTPNNVDERDEKPEILTLPLDSLHQIASFLTPAEWLHFAQSNRAAGVASREIVRRVRLHGFKCAAEVISAWKLGHHSDARELAALYVQSGVPIYPRSLGHSYHTLLWKMQVESREMARGTQGGEGDERMNRIDPFFLDRMEFRLSQEYSPELTYVEEKCLYHWTKHTIETDTTPPSSISRNPHLRRRLPPPLRQNSSDTTRGSSNRHGRVHSPSAAVASDNESMLIEQRRLPVRVHRHLLDQHVRRKFCVNDHDGSMITPGFSLSADFFHPLQETLGGATCTDACVVDLQSIPENIESTQAEVMEESVPAVQLPLEMNGVEPRIRMPDADDILVAQERRRPPSPTRIMHALESCKVEAYTASMETSLEFDEGDGSRELRNHLRSRFSTYQRRLEGLLVQMDTSGFEECILDLWDEFFPHTAYIQYFDMHTAVPRVSCLQKFLTRPCPKAIGIVQCEIERIKITTKGNGVSMKGRLFPTYEYRLFIRHRPHNQAPESALEVQDDESFDRRDTVLMVAKNRGRKHTEISGVGPTKKGSNNYYLYMPQQMDVDAHYNKVNIHAEASKMIPNGASLDPVLVSEETISVLMGRLQSNFIGTEFQIFTPRLKKPDACRKAELEIVKTVYSPSDDEVDYDNCYSSDTNPTRRSRHGIFRLASSQPHSESSCEVSTPRDRAHSVPRSGSSDNLRRPNRRAIANAEGISTQSSVSEEEDGVITYTANLLGSRPRIMDVCIPRVNPDSVTGTDWRRYLESVDEPEEGRMLSCFRQLLQRLDNLDPQQPRVDGGDGAQEPHHRDNDDAGNPVSTSGGDDFGLVPLQNRPPWWNVELGSFVLNFGGRVSVASVKNFQLCDRNDQDNIMLQFGRIHGRHSFTMDFQYPLTAVQAFSIAISSLQSKISFG